MPRSQRPRPAISKDVLDEIVFAHVAAHGRHSVPSKALIVGLANCAGASEADVMKRFEAILAEGWGDFGFRCPYRSRKKLVAEANKLGVPVRSYIAAILERVTETRAEETADPEPPTTH
jgi:hypothetical protein